MCCVQICKNQASCTCLLNSGSGGAWTVWSPLWHPEQMAMTLPPVMVLPSSDNKVFAHCTTYTASRTYTGCHCPGPTSEIAWYTNMDSTCNLYEQKVHRTLVRSSTGSHHAVVVVEDFFSWCLLILAWRSSVGHVDRCRSGQHALLAK
jgi:hypothetical protein